MASYLQRSPRGRWPLYPAIYYILRNASFSPPKPLRQLAEISQFNLFVTTNFDLFLEQALDAVRFGGAHGTATSSYAPNDVEDLECAIRELRRPTVFHLLGRFCSSPGKDVKCSSPGKYVICDEDLLKFVHRLLQESDDQRPKRLFDELRDNHLLILGQNFSDWLARFFLYSAKWSRSSETPASLAILADKRTSHDANLVLFLQQFSSRIQVFQGGGAVEFVEELWQRWRKRYPAPVASPENFVCPPPREMPAGAVFISYAIEDLPAVTRLKAGLDAAGLPVWFDMDQLGAGDHVERTIRRNINDCSCFVALISKNTEKRKAGYFWREWNRALDRDASISPSTRFLIPVLIDETEKPSEVPDRFREVFYTKLPDGDVTPEFVKSIRDIVAQALNNPES